jgi:hypothetical protein
VYGFEEEPDLWADLAQASAEVNDDIEGCFNRPTAIDIEVTGRQYGPVEGITQLRIAVARLYNVHHRYVACSGEIIRL